MIASHKDGELISVARVAVCLALIMAGSNDAATEASPSDWYTRYPAYHPYCSTRDDMKQRGIPEVKDDPRLGESRLLHASIIIRHGARE